MVVLAKYQFDELNSFVVRLQKSLKTLPPHVSLNAAYQLLSYEGRNGNLSLYQFTLSVKWVFTYQVYLIGSSAARSAARHNEQKE